MRKVFQVWKRVKRESSEWSKNIKQINKRLEPPPPHPPSPYPPKKKKLSSWSCSSNYNVSDKHWIVYYSLFNYYIFAHYFDLFYCNDVHFYLFIASVCHQYVKWIHAYVKFAFLFSKLAFRDYKELLQNECLNFPLTNIAGNRNKIIYVIIYWMGLSRRCFLFLNLSTDINTRRVIFRCLKLDLII